jgi:hypothetical protein
MKKLPCNEFDPATTPEAPVAPRPHFSDSEDDDLPVLPTPRRNLKTMILDSDEEDDLMPVGVEHPSLSEAEVEYGRAASPSASSEGEGVSLDETGSYSDDDPEGSELNADLSGFIVDDDEVEYASNASEDGEDSDVPFGNPDDSHHRSMIEVSDDSDVEVGPTRHRPLRTRNRSSDSPLVALRMDSPASSRETSPVSKPLRAASPPVRSKPRPVTKRSPTLTKAVGKAQFKKERDGLAQHLFVKFNKDVFQDIPSDTKIVWSKKLNTTAGRAVLQRHRKTDVYSAYIELSTKVSL